MRVTHDGRLWTKSLYLEKRLHFLPRSRKHLRAQCWLEPCSLFIWTPSFATLLGKPPHSLSVLSLILKASSCLASQSPAFSRGRGFQTPEMTPSHLIWSKVQEPRDQLLLHLEVWTAPTYLRPGRHTLWPAFWGVLDQQSWEKNPRSCNICQADYFVSHLVKTCPQPLVMEDGKRAGEIDGLLNKKYSLSWKCRQ